MDLTHAGAKKRGRGIDEITVLLGAPVRQSMRTQIGGTVLNRTSWDCGCVVDCIERSLDDPQEAVVQWGMCGEHRNRGLPPRA